MPEPRSGVANVPGRGPAPGTAPRFAIDRRRALLQAALIGLAVVWLTGAIPRWGQWYSEQPYYRAQAHALLDGRLALSHEPAGLGLDLVWIDGSVHQVWGLGVPMWLAAWEAIGRVIHVTPFPDRLAMLSGAVLVLYALVRAWHGPGGDRSWGSRGAFLFTALLPGVIAMLRGRVVVYEEAAAYAYGAAMLLLAGVMMMVRRPSTARYVLLLGFAGATGLVRPTVWFYGAAAAGIATVLHVRHRGSLRAALPSLVLAWGLFLAGGGALYLTNALRFGDGAEFGHRINLGNLYATRFANPYAAVPAPAAAGEMLGGMFGRPELAAHRELYDPAIHAWQARAPRFREYYFTTYTWPYAPLALAGLVCGAVAWLRARRPAGRAGPGPDLDRDTRWLVAWAVLGAAPLVAFYLHSPAISSRYWLDLGPAIAVLVATAWRYAAGALGRRGQGGQGAVSSLAFAGFALWWAVSLLGFRNHRAWLSPVGQTAAYASMMNLVDPPRRAPLVPAARAAGAAYDLADPWLAAYLGGEQWWCRCYIDPADARACDHRGLAGGETVERVRGDRPEPRDLERRIDPGALVCTGAAAPDACSVDDTSDGAGDAAGPRGAGPGAGELPAVVTWHAPPALYDNGTTWDAVTGAVGVATYLFADDPAYVEVEVAPGDRSGLLAPGFVPDVRVRIEREELPLVATASTPRGARLRFAGPRTPSFRRGLQVIFLAFGPPDRLDRPASGYSLLRVTWRDPPERP
jgi:hypothetical protein